MPSVANRYAQGSAALGIGMEISGLPTTTSHSLTVAGGGSLRGVYHHHVIEMLFVRTATIGDGKSVDVATFGGGVGHAFVLGAPTVLVPTIQYHAILDHRQLAAHAIALSIPTVLLSEEFPFFFEFAPYGGPAFQTEKRKIMVEAGLQFRWGVAID